jgi:hypothetical protein
LEVLSFIANPRHEFVLDRSACYSINQHAGRSSSRFQRIGIAKWRERAGASTYCAPKLLSSGAQGGHVAYPKVNIMREHALITPLVFVARHQKAMTT